MTKIRWGIISTGRMADWFCSDFSAVENSLLNAVSSRGMEAANAFADRYSIPNRFNSVSDMIASGTVDIVYIATPHTTHKAIACEALAAKMPVLCEKPFVTSVADAEDVISAAVKSNTYFAEAMWTWHLPAIEKAKQWVDDGRIGKIVHLKTDFGYPIPYSENKREYDANDAGGALREMGVYPIAISRRFIDRDPVNIHVTHQSAPNGVEMDLTATFDFEDMTSIIATSFRCRMRNAACIVGENGYITISDAFRAHRAELYRLDDLIETFEEPRAERGYHYMARATAQDLLYGKLQSDTAPHAASVSFQKDMKRILDATGRGEH